MTQHNEEFIRKVTERRRLVILLLLLEEPDRRMSESLLLLGLETTLFAVNRDVLTEDAEFLRRAGLVTRGHLGHMPALTLTDTGGEAARGLRVVSGVQKPPLD